MKLVFLIIFPLVTGLVTQAQQPDPSAAPAPAVPTVPPVPAVPGEVPPTLALPSQNFLEPYIFDAREGRRNPFRPFVIRGEDGTSMTIGPATPLERYEVDELVLLAVMWDVKTPKAMIMDPQKNIHTIVKDDRIGRRKGYVATIREGEVVIVETSEFNGEPVFSTRVLELKK